MSNRTNNIQLTQSILIRVKTNELMNGLMMKSGYKLKKKIKDGNSAKFE